MEIVGLLDSSSFSKSVFSASSLSASCTDTCGKPWARTGSTVDVKESSRNSLSSIDVEFMWGTLCRGGREPLTTGGDTTSTWTTVVYSFLTVVKLWYTVRYSSRYETFNSSTCVNTKVYLPRMFHKYLPLPPPQTLKICQTCFGTCCWGNLRYFLT